MEFIGILSVIFQNFLRGSLSARARVDSPDPVKLSVFVLKVSNLEAQNRHLSDELGKLKSKWGRETAQVKAMYQTELDEARQAFDELAGKGKARLEVRASTLEDLAEELRAK